MYISYNMFVNKIKSETSFFNQLWLLTWNHKPDKIDLSRITS